MTDLDRLSHFYDLNVMKRANLPGSGIITYGGAGTDRSILVDHNLGYNPFFIAGADIFRNGIIWSNNYVNEYTESSLSGPVNMFPQLNYWCNSSQLTINLRNGDGTNTQSGSADVYYAVYLDYDTSVNPIDDLVSISDYSQDKIVYHDTITIVNDGVTTGTTYTWQQNKVVQSTIPNPYGRAALARARWSIDGGASWQSLESKIVYTYTLTAFGVVLWSLDSAISIGCSDSTIYFRTANGRHGNVTGNPPTGYTPTSRTFLIEFWLYERE